MISNGADKALLGPQITNHFAFLESELAQARVVRRRRVHGGRHPDELPDRGGRRARRLRRQLPKLKGFVERIQARPAYKRALERGGPQTFLK